MAGATTMALLLAACAAPGAPRTPDGFLSGTVEQPIALDPATLRALPAETITVNQSTDGGRPARSVLRGVRIRTLVEQARLTDAQPHGWKTRIVVATATDGYRALFSWPELSNTAVGDGALVVYERDGQPLGTREGPLAIYSASDLRGGPRHLRNLARIDVQAVP